MLCKKKVTFTLNARVEFEQKIFLEFIKKYLKQNKGKGLVM
jgi:hypothetical protein